MNKLNYLQKKLVHFQLKYPNSPLYCAFRMFLSSILALFINENIKFNKNNIIILFDVKGGLGDAIIASNFINCFYNYVKDPNIKIKIIYNSKEIIDTIFSGLPKDIVLHTNTIGIKTNLRIELNRFPKVPLKIKTKNPRLNNILNTWHNFFFYNHKLIDTQPNFDGLANDYAEILELKRINQADIGGILNLSEAFEYKIPIKNEAAILKNFTLSNIKYITIHLGRPIGIKALTNNKLWPEEYWQILIKNLKKQYPDYTLVLLGINKKRIFRIFEDIDIDLRNKTSLEDIKIILKNSLLHIDTEGGFIHLRHALKGGPSVVLFGPTNPKIYGYTENLNLRSKSCLKPCEWVTNDWMTRCPRRNNKNICMKSLTPDIVFYETKRFIDNKGILK